ncbi:hypothetical protein LTR36_001571 [Oleoguttula mirabilis]|uniref:Uncharacterized protein n=1 Tax=Oleoguttula mirabilis TaxID=1507867 RepID=A0AAV9JNX0_9PEZI|nr:hypothetical protein LTR36_001571 [Oleoguttula mirabilis]
MEESDENALWRDFVVGSQDDDSDSSQRLGKALMHNAVELEEQPATLAAYSLAVGGLGTSEEATLGDKLFVSDSAPSSMQHLLPKRKAELELESVPQPRTSVAVIEGDTEAGNDRDRIEDSEPAYFEHTQPYNIHASAVAVLKPNLFKRRLTAPPRKPNRFTPSRKSKAAKPAHSIYDLVDSDGMSLA